MSPITISTIVGVTILVVLCLSDFRARAVRTSHAAYYVSAFLFLLINIALYGPLMFVLLGFGGERVKMVEDLRGDSGSEGTRVLVPVIVAFLYFGAGAATVKLGQLEFSLYDKLSVFSRLFRLEVATGKVRKAIEQSDYGIGSGLTLVSPRRLQRVPHPRRHPSA